METYEKPVTTKVIVQDIPFGISLITAYDLPMEFIADANDNLPLLFDQPEFVEAAYKKWLYGEFKVDAKNFTQTYAYNLSVYEGATDAFITRNI